MGLARSRGFARHLATSLRLHFRNRMALLYGYLFPSIFLGAFWVLYRWEPVPLVRHMGELLTISILGGACFGLPTTLVSERERGVWRRFRIAPVSTLSLLASTLVARYTLLVTAGLLQIGLALAVGMPVPRHPFDLWLAFTFVSFAFLGLGLVMSAMADNVPAVQALGQCIFLPMLIIGGVAVPLASLPLWAQHLSAFFPGRYGVEALQVSVSGAGIGVARFSLLALTLIGAAGCVTGARMFRWDAQERFAAREGKGRIAVALAAWIAIGLAAESRGRVVTRSSTPQEAQGPAVPAPSVGPPAGAPPPSPAPAPTSSPPAPTAPARERKATLDTAHVAVPKATPPPASPTPPPGPSSWQAVTREDIERDLVFDRLPSDAGVVTPIARADEEPDPEVAEQLEFIRRKLPEWPAARVGDPVQRVRNLLYVAAVPDVFQTPLERFTPWAVYERLQADVPQDTLIKILYWIALHPGDGDDKAVDELYLLGLGNGPSDMDQTRDRVALYGVKLLGRLLGKIKSQ